MPNLIYRHIDKVGVELEGSWDQTEALEGFHGDGSVTTIGYQTGEIASPALPPAAMYEWIKREDRYPTYINDSCGFHVHLSTKTHNDYAALMHADFNTAFLENAESWATQKNYPVSHQYRKRLAGRNSYCTRQFIPLQQYFHKSKGYSRYTQLNYCAGVHKTLECRLFPMFEYREEASDCVRYYIEFVERWLRVNSARLAGKVHISHPFDQKVERIIIRGAA